MTLGRKFFGLLLALGICSDIGFSQEKLSYHIGIASSVLWYDNGLNEISSTNGFAIPIGANLPVGKNLLYDVQLTPVIGQGDMTNFILLHGLFYDIGGNFWADFRPAVEFMDRQAYGFNIGMNKLLFFPLDIAKKKNIFIVLAVFLPFRFGARVEDGDLVIPTFGTQLGFAF